MDPSDGGVGGQCLSPSDSGCAGEGVGLASSEGTSGRGDGGCDSEYCRKMKSGMSTIIFQSIGCTPFVMYTCSHNSKSTCMFLPRHMRLVQIHIYTYSYTRQSKQDSFAQKFSVCTIFKVPNVLEGSFNSI